MEIIELRRGDFIYRGAAGRGMGVLEPKWEIVCNRKDPLTLYMKVAEINSPEDVRKYNGWGLSVPRRFAHPLEKDEYYIKDLIGCSLIFDKTGLAEFAAPAGQFETVGTITDALEGGAGYLLEVSISESCTVLGEKLKFTSSGKQRKVLIPFTLKHICNIDVKAKTKNEKGGIFSDGYINVRMCKDKDATNKEICFFMQWVDKETFNKLNPENKVEYSFKLETENSK